MSQPMKFTVFKSPVIMPMMKIQEKKSRKKETTNEIKKAERNTERQEETRKIEKQNEHRGDGDGGMDGCESPMTTN